MSAWGGTRIERSRRVTVVELEGAVGREREEGKKKRTGTLSWVCG